MKSIQITIEGKNYQLFYTHMGGQILTRLEQTSEEASHDEPMPEGENVCNLIFATQLFGKAEARMWGGWKTPIKVNEWKSYALQRKGMNKGKVEQFVAVALEVFLPLNGLVKELRRK